MTAAPDVDLGSRFLILKVGKQTFSHHFENVLKTLSRNGTFCSLLFALMFLLQAVDRLLEFEMISVLVSALS